MKTCYIVYANGEVDVLTSSGDAFELDFQAINLKAAQNKKRKINSVEFRYDGRSVGTVLFY